MVLTVALKLVERPEFYEEHVELWSAKSDRDSHSLHYVVPMPGSARAEIPAYLIDRFSVPGDVVLDPFCGGGTTALEACLSGRIPFVSDLDPLALRITRAKLDPADITEVALRLQQFDLQRPVNLAEYQDNFSPFYDPDTYREVFNLKRMLHYDYDRVARFIELVAMGLLHGHSAGYFSVHTFPQFCLSPENQAALNTKRRQIPDYRAVLPRILRRTASVLRDGVPSILRKTRRHSRTALTPATDLSFVPSGKVGLVVTELPLPVRNALAGQMWLREWFTDSESGQRAKLELEFRNLEHWSEYMNGVLLELARVVKPQGRAALGLKQVRVNGEVCELEQVMADLVRSELGRYWDPEGVLVCDEKRAKVGPTAGQRRVGDIGHQHRVLMLRRR